MNELIVLPIKDKATRQTAGTQKQGRAASQSAAVVDVEDMQGDSRQPGSNQQAKECAPTLSQNTRCASAAGQKRRAQQFSLVSCRIYNGKPEDFVSQPLTP